MGWKIQVGLAGLLVASAVPSRAQVAPRGLSSSYVACQARAQGNTVQGNLCSQVELVSQDARLNKAYKRVMQQLAGDSAGRQSLQGAEQSWLKRRDYECDLGDHTTDTDCLVRQTAVRASELETEIRF